MKKFRSWWNRDGISILTGALIFCAVSRARMSSNAKGNAANFKIESRPHPRGFAGGKHSVEAIAIITEKSKASWASKTQEEIMAWKLKGAKTKVANGTQVPQRHGTTWKAGWREIGGKRVYYRSRWEANYARVLEWMKSKGEVLEWAHEPETFWFAGVKRGAVSYLPDFKIKFRNESIEFHEVKGWMDPRSKTKIKRMAKYHPKVILRVIDSKAYKVLTKQMGGLIPDWE